MSRESESQHQNLGSSYKTENSVYTTVYNRFFRKHGRFDRRNGQRNRAVTHTPNLSTTFAGIRTRRVRELRRVGQGGVRRFVPKSLSHGADQRARLARQKKPPKPANFDAGLAVVARQSLVPEASSREPHGGSHAALSCSGEGEGQSVHFVSRGTRRADGPV